MKSYNLVRKITRNLNLNVLTHKKQLFHNHNNRVSTKIFFHSQMSPRDKTQTLDVLVTCNRKFFTAVLQLARPKS